MSEILALQETTTIASPSLELGQIHLWWVSLSIDKELQKKFTAELNQHQRQKFNRLKDPLRQQFYVAGRGYLNQLLRHYVGPQASIELIFSEHGKPTLRKNPQQLMFNFTDTCGFGLFAFALSNELGIDIEHAEREGEFTRIVERRFAPEEQYLRSGSMHDFLQCWTRKEAYGKAIGKGLSYPLRQYTVCEDLSKSEFTVSDDEFYGQQVTINFEQKRYIACVVSQGLQAKQIQAFHLSAKTN